MAYHFFDMELIVIGKGGLTQYHFYDAALCKLYYFFQDTIEHLGTTDIGIDANKLLEEVHAHKSNKHPMLKSNTQHRQFLTI